MEDQYEWRSGGFADRVMEHFDDAFEVFAEYSVWRCPLSASSTPALVAVVSGRNPVFLFRCLEKPDVAFPPQARAYDTADPALFSVVIKFVVTGSLIHAAYTTCTSPNPRLTT